MTCPRCGRETDTGARCFFCATAKPEPRGRYLGASVLCFALVALVCVQLAFCDRKVAAQQEVQPIARPEAASALVEFYARAAGVAVVEDGSAHFAALATAGQACCARIDGSCFWATACGAWGVCKKAGGCPVIGPTPTIAVPTPTATPTPAPTATPGPTPTATPTPGTGMTLNFYFISGVDFDASNHVLICGQPVRVELCDSQGRCVPVDVRRVAQ